MSHVLRRSRNPQYLHLYRKCIASYRMGMIDLAYCRYPECLWNMYEVLEFFWKAIHFLQNGKYPPRHLPNLQDFAIVSSFLQNYGRSSIVSQVRSIYRRNNPGWQRNPRQRVQPRYGDEQTGLPPSRLYNRTTAERAVRYSFTIANELAIIHRRITLQQPEMLMGILNGAFSRSRSEIRCSNAPYADVCGPAIWRHYLSGIPNIRPRLRAISELDNSLSCVINPFGESYPEKPSASNILPGYELMRDYIFSGGAFVSCGGMPFTYYHDVITGRQINVSTVVPNYPIALRLVMMHGKPQVQLLSTTLLVNNLIQRDYDVMVAMDDPSSNLVGPIPVQIYQNPPDRHFWNCIHAGNTLHAFRPIDPAVSPTAIAVVRAQRGGQEVYPVAFVRYGFGIFMHIGLDLSQGRNTELDFARDVIRGFLQNFQAYF